MAKTGQHIVVAGDVVVDHHFYEGERLAATDGHKRGVQHLSEVGGAAALYRTLNAAVAVRAGGAATAEMGVVVPDEHERSQLQQAYAVWRPFKQGRRSSTPDKLVWRAASVMGFGEGEADQPALAPIYRPRPADVLVLDDAGFLFRTRAHRQSWLLSDDMPPPRWILLKASYPLAHGDLWHDLTNRFADRLVCFVGAQALREGFGLISRGLSWELTIEEVCSALQTNAALKPLLRCRHLIVGFSADGALWLDLADSERPKATLVFDPSGAEGETEGSGDGTLFGYSACFTSAIALALAETPAGEAPKLEAAIRQGLTAARDLFDFGHGEFTPKPPAKPPSGFPAERLARVIAALPKWDAEAPLVDGFASASAPWTAASGHAWTIIESKERPEGVVVPVPLTGLARRIVRQGTAALADVPHDCFGDLITVDRKEIETLRSLRRLMRGYDQDKGQDRPLSIGVFGPPGAGKSFGVKQIGAQVFGQKARDAKKDGTEWWMEFNLSQFAGEADLIGAFHQVRDRVLSGTTPVVFWDEFDSNDLVWLKSLLAPMQDGRFQEGQVSHWIGRCVFVFAGGTSPTFEDFGACNPDDFKPARAADPKEIDAWRDFGRKKGPDFKSRLDAYYDVVGPNPRMLRGNKAAGATPAPDPDDLSFPLRRALMIRQFLAKKSKAVLNIDTDLLDALLLAPKYSHGSRSLQKLVMPLKAAEGEMVVRADLPAPDQLAMHVDAAVFHRLLTRNDAFRSSPVIETLAATCHGLWLDSLPELEAQFAAIGGLSPVSTEVNQFRKTYDKLSLAEKEDNRAAARRIPQVLAMIGLAFVDEAAETQSDEPSLEAVRALIELHIETLAEAEHEGWCEHRLREGWRKTDGETDKPQLLHHLLRPYAELPEGEKEKDRLAVRAYPLRAAAAGQRIVWLR